MKVQWQVTDMLVVFRIFDRVQKREIGAEMNFSLPIARPFGLSNWPGRHCGAEGLGRATATHVMGSISC